MAEPVGTALGVLGLAGLFKTTLEIWEFVDAGRGHALSFDRLRNKLDNQRACFMIWGQRMGFGTPQGYDKRLDNDLLRPRIEQTMLHIQQIFTDTDVLVQRYGIKVISKSSTGISPANAIPSDGAEARPGLFKSRYELLTKALSSASSSNALQDSSLNKSIFSKWRESLRQKQKKASVGKITLWAIRDEKKFDALVKDLKDHVGDLDQLTARLDALPVLEDIALETVRHIDSIEALEEIRLAEGDESSLLSTAVSVRMLNIEAETLRSGHTRSTFYTAPSQPFPTQNVPLAPAVETSDATHLSTRNIAIASEIMPTSAIVFQELVEQNRKATLEMEEVNSVYRQAAEDYSITRNGVRRLVTELRRLGTFKPRAGEPVYWTASILSPHDILELLGTILGPEGTPYAGGVFHLRMSFKDTNYPWGPPKVWFLTKIYHPNVNRFGAICLDILEKSGWNVPTTIELLLKSITSLLDGPGWDEPLEEEVAAVYQRDRSEYERIASNWTEKYATGELIFPGQREDGFHNTTDQEVLLEGQSRQVPILKWFYRTQRRG